VEFGTRPGYIDESGEVVIARDQFNRFASLHSFSEGLAALPYDSKTVYIDRNGSIAFEVPGSGGREFHEGLAVYHAPPKRPQPPESDRNSSTPPRLPPPIFSVGAVGYIDKQGAFAIEPRFAAAGPFVDGLARVVPDGRCYVLSADGWRAGTPTTGTTSSSCGGPPRWVRAICPVGFINKSGEFVIQPQFESAMDFSEGLAAVRIRGRWGFIDRSGALVVEAQFSAVRPFHEGRAAVSTGGKWGFIDQSGKLVVPAVWDDAGVLRGTGARLPK
jgi:hypothetical protein